MRINNSLRVILICLCLVMGCNSIYSQDLRVLKTTVTKKEIKLSLEILNTDQISYHFYIPELTDVCAQIIQFQLISSNNEVHFYDPCDRNDQIDHIELNEDNNIFLKKNQSYKICYVLMLDSFTNSEEINFINSNYNIKCVINYSDFIFKGYDYIYNKNLYCKIKVK